MKIALHLIALLSAIVLFAVSIFLRSWPMWILQGVGFLLCLMVVASNVYALMQQRARGQ